MPACAKSLCLKKTFMSSPSCKCGLVFCPNHRMPDDHACEYDYVSRHVDMISTANPRVVVAKVEKI